MNQNNRTKHQSKTFLSIIMKFMTKRAVIIYTLDYSCNLLTIFNKSNYINNPGEQYYFIQVIILTLRRGNLCKVYLGNCKKLVRP